MRRGAAVPANDAGFLLSRWREISSFVGQLGLRHDEPDREDQIICGGCKKPRGRKRGRKGQEEDDGRAQVTTDRGRGNNLANRVAPGAGWSIGACDCDNIRMRTGGWRDWNEAGRLSHLKSCVRCSCACSPIEDDRTANGISKWRSITKLVTQINAP